MDQPTLRERRRFKRRSLSYYMLVMDPTTRETIGHLVDITPGGLMLDSRKPLPLEQNFRLRINTMPDVANKSSITFTARSKWCSPDAIERDLFDVGFSIVEINTEDAAIIKNIADKYARQDGFIFPAA